MTRDAEKTFEVYRVLAVLEKSCVPYELSVESCFAGRFTGRKQIFKARSNSQHETSDESKRGISTAAPATRPGVGANQVSAWPEPVLESCFALLAWYGWKPRLRESRVELSAQRFLRRSTV